MPLIDSPRLTDEDRVAWGATIRHYRRPRWQAEARARRAQGRIRAFLAGGGAHACVSWGKDSVVVAHLVRQVSPDIPLVWLRLVGAENPDCLAVRDAYLAEQPSNYVEVCRPVEWDGDGDMLEAPWTALLRDADREHGDRRIMGIRSQESGTRAMSAAVHGAITRRSCRPILEWTTAEVFVYLLAFDLPIHPAYAMTCGGRLDVERLRVDFLGDLAGRDRGRRDWERAYYGDCAPYSVAPFTGRSEANEILVRVMELLAGADR